MPTGNTFVDQWVDQVRALTTPDRVVFCDGSEAERDGITAECLASGELVALNQQALPGCVLHRSASHDVARTEHLTFISAANADAVGPTNNWMAPEQAREKLTPLFRGSMAGRTMYVVPFLMGPPGSRFSKVGVEITDSRYVVLNMRTMTRVGARRPRRARRVRRLHALPARARRPVARAPVHRALSRRERRLVNRVRLRRQRPAGQEVPRVAAGQLAGAQGRLARRAHADPRPAGAQRPVHYITGAFPSACGKTNMAMLVPPKSMPGWKIWTVGDDIAWLRPGPDGRLWAVNPEAGFFGVAPGTSNKTNPTAFEWCGATRSSPTSPCDPTARRGGKGTTTPRPPMRSTGRAGRGRRRPPRRPRIRTAASPRPPSECASLSPEFANPKGVPIDAILFGARRQRRVPLVYEARSWQHGTFLGATLSSETTAAATGKVGVLRRDPMAMLPFCGYNMGDYWGHWLDIGRGLTSPPKIFRVNWFRTAKTASSSGRGLATTCAC